MPQRPTGDTPFISRLERFASVDSTQRVVRGWLDAGDPGVCVAVADEQTSGRGRHGRRWTAPPGAALLVSAGFRPRRLSLRHAWRLAAMVSLAMLEAAEEAAGLRGGTLWLKWPNDLVAEVPPDRLLKVAGVLGETHADDDRVATAIIGIGVNADWSVDDFPSDLADAMTSLRELSGGRRIDREGLLGGWLARLEPRLEALDAGAFDAAAWSRRQRTTGRMVEVDLADERMDGLAIGVDPETGALLVQADGEGRSVGTGEVIRCRTIEPRAPSV